MLAWAPRLLAAALASVDGGSGQFAWERPLLDVNQSGIYRVPFDLDAYRTLARSDLTDMRIVDALGNEVPFVLERAQSTRAPSERREAQLLNPVRLSPSHAQVTLDFSDEAIPHDHVDLALSGGECVCKVTLSTSDDARTWGLLPVESRLVELSTLSTRWVGHSLTFPPTLARYVRADFDCSLGKAPAVTGARWWRPDPLASSKPPVLRWKVPVTKAEGPNAKGQWTMEVGAPHAPLSRVEFDIAAPATFERSVRVAALSKGSHGVDVASGWLFRTSQKSGTTVPLGGLVVESLQVRIDEGDNVPLEVRAASFEVEPMEIVFEATGPGAYTWFGGCKTCLPAQYDLELRLRRERPANWLLARFGEVKVASNLTGPLAQQPHPKDPEPDARFKVGALVVVLLGLGAWAVRLLQKGA